jgi:glycosyltransferase involved in cell wall biosynthesis
MPGHVGLGINQAFYWGLPVITEEGGQPPEFYYLKDGVNGFVVSDNDKEALKEKALLLLDNDVLRSQFSKNARHFILENASVENMFSGFNNCISNLKRKEKI